MSILSKYRLSNAKIMPGDKVIAVNRYCKCNKCQTIEDNKVYTVGGGYGPLIYIEELEYDFMNDIFSKVVEINYKDYYVVK